MNAPVHVDPAEDAYALPLDAIDVSNPKLYQNDVWYPYFERLRREDPVHYTKDGMYGSYWSVTKYKDIMSVEVDHHPYSSEAMLGGISITDRPVEYRRASFISMDPPKHTDQRRVVAPTFTPTNMLRWRWGFANACAAFLMACRARRCSIGSIWSLLRSRRRCLPPCSTSPSRSDAS